MGALKAIAIAAALVGSASSRAENVADWRAYVVEASVRFDIPVTWIERVMQAESAGRTKVRGRPIISRAGAMGLMQLMPTTWAEMRAAYALGDNPHDPHDNIVAGTAYLRAMYDRFGYPGLFAAYNAGPGRYSAYLSGGRALPDETRNYLATVSDAAVTAPQAQAQAQALRPRSTLFAVLRAPPPPSKAITVDAASPSLFVLLSPR
jgi:soluble lytic murein transglycosylase-like protein